MLAECGSDKSKLLWARLWVTDMRNFAAMNEVWHAWIGPANPPVRAGLCSDLAAPDYKVAAGLFDDQSLLRLSLQVFTDHKPAFYAFANDTKMMTEAEVIAIYAPPPD